MLASRSVVAVLVRALGRVSKVGGSREMLRAWDEGTSLTSSGPGCSRCYPREGRPATQVEQTPADRRDPLAHRDGGTVAGRTRTLRPMADGVWAVSALAA